MAIRTQIEFTRTYQDLGVQVPAWFRVCDVIRSVRPPEISLILYQRGLRDLRRPDDRKSVLQSV